MTEKKLFTNQVSENLKNIRQSRGLSLDATAKLTGVSKAMLGQIERLESSPTIATLWKIASGLQMSFSSFLIDPKAVQSTTTHDDANMEVKVLFEWQADTQMEVLQATLLNHHTQISEPHAPGTIEHVIVTQGTIQIFVEEKWHTLEAGTNSAMLKFKANQPHRYKAITEKVVFQNIINYTMVP